MKSQDFLLTSAICVALGWFGRGTYDKYKEKQDAKRNPPADPQQLYKMQQLKIKGFNQNFELTDKNTEGVGFNSFV